MVVQWQVCGVRAGGRGKSEQRAYVPSVSRYYRDVAVPCIEAARIPRSRSCSRGLLRLYETRSPSLFHVGKALPVFPVEC